MPRPALKFSGPVLDAPDVPALAAFYEKFLGWAIQDGGPYWAVLRPTPEQQGHKIEIQHEPNYIRPTWPAAPGEPGMQVHLDFWVDDLKTGVAWVVECGGAQAEWQPSNRDLTRLRIMLDPAGHPFCLWT